ncbi:5-methylcytosine restriction system specificity protein McrC [Serinicoccus kebangsaanensis]|uniref:5-methylcytosine restriction system specificity protein McrC n=1 Tax=Serinicoccus kebangsaanensis TaxID=2602069 RepID=UPI00178C4B37|nr:5-methylcytosine-specific restriction endonuclease system specificity protein McrC [Serinicoccus kebangsaanensis]
MWLLQLYASSLYRAVGHKFAAAEENPEDLPALVAGILADAVTQRLHTGLSVGFRQTSRPVTRIRGRINVLPTARHQLLPRGQVHCTFDEVVTDTPANRLVRFALWRAAVLVPGEPRLRSLALQFEAAGVRGPCPPLSHVPGLHRERLLVRDRQMIAAADLLLGLALPATDDGSKFLPVPDMNEHYLRDLFERACVGFYRLRLRPQGWKVKHGSRLKWDASSMSSGMDGLLPSMKLDIELVQPHPTGPGRRRIIVDTKFTSVTKTNQFGDLKLRSGYVYQIYAYLMSQEASEIDPKSEGLMLHPTVGEPVDEEVVIQGHRIRFATVDLAADAPTMADQLLEAITPSCPSAAPTVPVRARPPE